MVGRAVPLAAAEQHMSSRMSLGRLALATGLIAVAVLLVLVAHDAWRWGRALHDGDRRAAVERVGASTWSASTVLPSRLVTRVLGVNDDLDYRRTVAAAITQILAAPTTPPTASTRPVILAETNLVRLAQTDPDPKRASRAADYLGLLFYAERNNAQAVINPYVNPKDAGAGKTSDTSPVQKAVAQFALAIRLDPTNADAKRHLETLLHQVVPPSRHEGVRPGSGEQVGSKGSGAHPPGYGY
jgi:hypothetical protein